MLEELLERKKLSLDIEFGNQYSFFSGSREGYVIESYDFRNKLTRAFKAEIPKAKGELLESLEFSKKKLVRELKFTPENEAVLYDFVSRYVVWSSSKKAIIGSRIIEHSSSNLYYQYSSHNSVKIPISNKGWLGFDDSNSSLEPYFDNVFYIRDEAFDGKHYKWVVHHRKIVKPQYAEFILRCCNPKFEGVVPLQHYIPKIAKKLFFRIRERKYPSFPLMSVGVVNVDNDVLRLTTTVKWVSNNES